MKNLRNKSFIQKLVISILCVIMLINFCMTSRVQASLGGTMMNYIVDFTTALADVVATLVQLGVTGDWDWAVDIGAGLSETGHPYWKSRIDYPVLKISPELIFANEVEMLDANFISPVNDKQYELNLEDDAPLKMLRNIIAGWYVTLRTIAVVGLLSVLVYMGIRIIISSTASDKAKYKQRLLDWVVAFCLLFFMHYIMAAVVTVVEKVDYMLGDIAGVQDGLELMEKYGGVRYSGNMNSESEDEPSNSESEDQSSNAESGDEPGSSESGDDHSSGGEYLGDDHSSAGEYFGGGHTLRIEANEVNMIIEAIIKTMQILGEKNICKDDESYQIINNDQIDYRSDILLELESELEKSKSVNFNTENYKIKIEMDKETNPAIGIPKIAYNVSYEMRDIR